MNVRAALSHSAALVNVTLEGRDAGTTGLRVTSPQAA
jgi:hypothetical protein